MNPQERRILSHSKWTGEPHQLHEQICAAFDRTGQVWELDEDTLIYFVVGPPVVARYMDDGRPCSFVHRCFAFDESGETDDWPLYETVDRPLETMTYTRLG